MGKNPAHTQYHLSIDQKKRAVKTRPFGREVRILIHKYLIWKGFVGKKRQFRPRFGSAWGPQKVGFLCRFHADRSKFEKHLQFQQFRLGA